MSRKLVLIYSGFFLLVPMGWAQGHNGSKAVAGQILCQKRNNLDAPSAERALTAHGAAVHARIPQIGVFVLNVPAQAADAISRNLERDGVCTFAEPDVAAQGAAIRPNDPSYASQWHLPAIDAPDAWMLSTGSASVPIAMVDSGVDSTHPDLAGRVIAGWNFVANSSSTADDLGHGTATAGTAAAASNNGVGGAGLAWQNPIMPIVVLDSTDYATYSNIASGITWAADHGARIINVSIGGSTASSTLQSAATYAWNKGAVVFASAMNNSTSSPYYPAACDNVVAVSSTEPGDGFSGFSNYGSWIDLSAPGDIILTTTAGGGYGTWYGTSFSSPLAAATGALMLSVNPTLSASQIVSLLESSADDLGTPGWDQYFGAGRVNAYKAVSAALAAQSSDVTPPTVTISSPSSGAVVSGTISVTGVAGDNVGVASTSLFVDGQLIASCGTSTWSCALNTVSLANGSHSLTVTAYDAANNSASASVSVTVSNGTTGGSSAPPVVSITSPANGAYVSSNVSISAKITDSNKISQASYYVDGVLKGTVTLSPYSWTWNARKVSGGSHTLTVKAWDVLGNTGSTSIAITH